MTSVAASSQCETITGHEHRPQSYNPAFLKAAMDGVSKFSMLNLGRSSKSSKKEDRWPNPEASTGDQYKSVHFGRSHCWEAIDDARKKFEEAASEIKEYLEKHSDPVTHTVTWTMYMIGRTRETSVPTIMFCSRNKEARLEIKKVVSDSGILRKYPGIQTGSCSEEFRHYAGDETVDQASIGTALAAGTAILYSSSDTNCGMRILFGGFGSEPFSLRPATGGGIILHQGTYYLATVAHIVNDIPPTVLPSLPESSSFEFELDSDSENDVEMSSRGSASPKTPVMEDSTISIRRLSDSSSESGEGPGSRPAREKIMGTQGLKAPKSIVESQTGKGRSPFEPDRGLLPVGDRIISSRGGFRPGLDYCLIEIKQKELREYNNITPHWDDRSSWLFPQNIVRNGPRDIDVVATIRSVGTAKGRLSGTRSYLMLPGTDCAQEVWTMRHDGPIVNGDCGAWVVDASTGDLFGHIVGGSPNFGITYTIPACAVFDDLVDRFGGEWVLATEDRVMDYTYGFATNSGIGGSVIKSFKGPEIHESLSRPRNHQRIDMPSNLAPPPRTQRKSEKEHMRTPYLEQQGARVGSGEKEYRHALSPQLYRNRVIERTRSPSPVRFRERTVERERDEDEGAYYARKSADRAYTGGQYSGATKDWNIVDVPPGTERQKFDLANADETQETSWQRYNGVRRSSFVSEPKRISLGRGRAWSDNKETADPYTRNTIVPLSSSSSSQPKEPSKEDVWTEITKDLVVRDAIEQIGYDFQETEDFYYVTSYLSYEDVQALVSLSDSIRVERRIRIKEIERQHDLSEYEDREVSAWKARMGGGQASKDEKISERNTDFGQIQPPSRRGGW